MKCLPLSSVFFVALVWGWCLRSVACWCFRGLRNFWGLWSFWHLVTTIGWWYYWSLVFTGTSGWCLWHAVLLRLLCWVL
jgi:hypothetical protein